MSSIVMGKVNHLIKQLRRSSEFMFSPNRGFRLHRSQVVQHLNPACRAARTVPHLSTARLLISLSDYDIPKPKPRDYGIFGYIYEFVFWLFVGTVVILTTMPELIQEVLIESSMTTIVNMLYFAIFVGGDNIFVAFCVGTGLIFSLFFVAECVASRLRAINWRRR